MPRSRMEQWSSWRTRIARLTTFRGRQREGLFVAEGVRLLRRALAAGWSPVKVFVADTLLSGSAARVRAGGGDTGYAQLRELLALVADWTTAPEEDLLALSEGRAAGRVLALLPLPAPVELDTTSASLSLVLVNVAEPGNLGALVRTGLAAGADELLWVGEGEPFHSKSVRTSLGSIFKLTPHWGGDTLDLVERLKSRRQTVVAAVAEGGAPLHAAQLPQGPCALLVGHEGLGLPDAIVRQADQRVTIALSRRADSFSVNAAAAICLYEIQRQRIFS